MRAAGPKQHPEQQELQTNVEATYAPPPPPRPLARTTVKALQMTETTPPFVLTRTLFTREDTSGGTTSVPGPGSMTCTPGQPDMRHQAAGRDQHPKTTISRPKSPKTLGVHHWKMEPPNLMVPKVAETEQPIQVLHAVRTGVSAEAGRGRATVPPPKVAETEQPVQVLRAVRTGVSAEAGCGAASCRLPWCTRRERRTRAKRSGCL